MATRVQRVDPARISSKSLRLSTRSNLANLLTKRSFRRLASLPDESRLVATSAVVDLLDGRLMKHEGLDSRMERLNSLSGRALKKARKTVLWGDLDADVSGIIQSYEVPLRRPRRAERSSAILDAWGSVLPIRIAQEDLGGYVEDANRRALEGQRVRVWLRVASGILWTAVNAVGYLCSKLLKRRGT